MKAVFLDVATLGENLDLSPLTDVIPNLELWDTTDNTDIAARIAGKTLVFTNKNVLTPPLLSAAPEVRFIGLTATGTDNIDLAFAKTHGIAVANTRAYCTASLVEHVFGVLLMLTHQLQPYRESVAAGDWQRADSPFLLAHPIRELAGMRLGIVGYGELGRGVARVAEAFGMEVLISARPGAVTLPPERIAFDDVVRRADAVSLHCPLTAATRQLFGARQFKAMPRRALFVNTARGGLVHSAALAEALASGEIAGAAVDVLPEEPPTAGDPLLDYLAAGGQKLIVTPHVAWASHEARQRAIDELALNTAAFLRGEKRCRVV